MSHKEIIFKDAFIKALEYCKNNNLYLGEGNPNARILIIGKECALDGERLGLKNASFRELENEIVRRNLGNWEEFIQKSVSIEDIEKLKSDYSANIDKCSTNQYYPYFPHVGQRFMVRNEKLIKKNENKSFPSEKGTSQTWYLYQRLIEAFRGKNNDLIDFHEDAFHTEINQIRALSTQDLPKAERKESIEKRRNLFKHDFIQQFPVVVFACGTKDIMGSEIEDIFNVSFNPDGRKLPCQTISDSQAFWTHYNQDKTKLVIQTRQLSNNVRRELPIEIGEVIREFLNS